MAIVIYDPYPVETKWRNSISEIDTPLHQLQYGIMSESISEKVINIHKNNRHNKVVKLIKKIHNDRLDDLWRIILSDAKKLPNFCRKNWNIGKKNKASRVEFFEKNDISIQYLENALEIQNGGNPEFQPGDLVIYHQHPHVNRACIIRKKIGRGKFYSADVCVMDYVRDYSETNIIYKPEPIWHRYRRLNPFGGGSRLIVEVDSWKCEKVGVETKKIIKDRINLINIYNKEFRKRNKFYKEIIRPLLEPDFCWSYQTFHDQQIDVWKLTEPPRSPWLGPGGAAHIPHRLVRWCIEWEIIIDNIRYINASS